MASIPVEPEKATLIRQQLERIIATRAFAGSKNYSSLLRYIVEEALAGRAEHLKERTIGVAVFGHDAAYDTSLHPVVRTAAAEIRVRLAAYYHGIAETEPIQIELPLGSYVPEFRLSPVPPPQEANSASGENSRIRLRASYLIWVTVALALVCAVLALRGPQAARDRFWRPILASQVPAVICLPGYPPQNLSGRTSALPVPAASVNGSIFDLVPFAEVRALSDITALLGEEHKSFRVRSILASNLENLRGRPVIVIGAFSNPWTMQLTEGLRFTFQRDEVTDTAWIADSLNPASRQWQIEDATAATLADKDYAVVARFWHSLTEQFVVVVAGLTDFGTVAAGDFVSKEGGLKELGARLEKDWDRKNLEVVIATKLVRSQPGPPRVMMAHVW